MSQAPAEPVELPADLHVASKLEHLILGGLFGGADARSAHAARSSGETLICKVMARRTDDDGLGDGYNDASLAVVRGRDAADCR
jgi:hypothetical protein